MSEMAPHIKNTKQSHVPFAVRILFGFVWLLNVLKLWIYEGAVLGLITFAGGLVFAVVAVRRARSRRM